MNAFARAGHNIAITVHAGTQAGPKALATLGAQMTSEIKRELSKPGRGRIYTRRGHEHQASAPGDPPAVDLGQYRASWDWSVAGEGGLAELSVGTPSVTGPWLEHGTFKMAARPHLRPVAERFAAAARASRTIGHLIREFQGVTIRGLPRG